MAASEMVPIGTDSRGGIVMNVIDLRSDTVTLPTQEMLSYMVSRSLGDDGRVKDGIGEDAAATDAQRFVAELFGREDSLFVPSGSMGNMVCLATHCKRGEKAVTATNMHMYKAEKGIFNETFCGIEAVCLPHVKGVYDMDVLEKTLAKGDIKLVCLENTYNFEGGCAISRADIEKILGVCHKHKVLTHIDGARIFNAAAALGTTVAELTKGVDSVQFCVSKGLSAPIGSFIVGSKEFIARARETRKLLGGQLRQVGLLAAAGRYAIEHLSARLVDDHARAKKLAEGISGAKDISIDPATVETNILKVDLHGSLKGRDWIAALEKEEGVRTHYVTDDAIRMVTYRGLSDDDIDEAIKRINSFCSRH